MIRANKISFPSGQYKETFEVVRSEAAGSKTMRATYNSGTYFTAQYDIFSFTGSFIKSELSGGNITVTAVDDCDVLLSVDGVTTYSHYSANDVILNNWNTVGTNSSNALVIVF